MGPESSSNLPSRPRFSWDIRNVPWTDGRGNQEQYAESVSLWQAFQDTLSDSNSNKVPKDAQGIMLQAQLYGRARYLCRSIPVTTIRSKNGAQAIVDALHKRDPLAVVSEVFQDFPSLLDTKRNQNESFENFESRFQAHVSRLNAHGEEAKLSDSLVAFALLANANVDSNQRVSVLANGAPRDVKLSSTATTNDYLKAVSYESIASVLRQCDRMRSTVEEPSPNVLSSHSVNYPSSGTTGRRGSQRQRRTPEQLVELKGKTRCRTCKKFGHWMKDHNPDGSLKPGFKSLDAPVGRESAPNKVLTFNMATLCMSDTSQCCFDGFAGPLLDNAAPYSGIGATELNLIRGLVCPDWNGHLDPLPQAVSDRPYWQYGKGEHSSVAKKILGSVLLSARTDEGTIVNIRHLVIEGSSQWVVDRNVTNYCDLLRVKQNILKLPPDCDGMPQGSISLVDQDMHTFIPHSAFTYRMPTLTADNQSTMFCAVAQLSGKSEHKPWAEMKRIVDKVHKHVCGHSTYSDIRILLERNGLWTSHVEKYLQATLERCTACRTTARPKSSRKVSLSAMSRSFNEVVCVDHLFLEQYCVMHVMDTASRYSAGTVVDDTSMEKAILVFDAHWLTPFWAPKVVSFDNAFKNTAFGKYLSDHDIEPRPLPPRRHNKNVLESKHRIIRDIFLRLKHAAEKVTNTLTTPLLIQQAIRISNDLYGSDVLSAQELAKGYCRPLENGNLRKLIPQQIVDAHNTLLAKRKLTRILRSKTFDECPVSVGDLVQVFVKHQHEKRGKWSQDKPILAYDVNNRTVTVPGSKGTTVSAAIEDVRPSIQDNELATAVRDAIDILDRNLGEVVDQLQHTEDSENQQSDPDDHSEPRTSTVTEGETEEGDAIGPNLPSVGDSIEVFWPIDDTFYPGTVHAYDPQNDKYSILYNDGDEEQLKLQNEVWNYVKEGTSTIQHDSASDDPVHTNTIDAAEIELSPGQELERSEHQMTKAYHDVFGTVEFMLHQAQGLPPYALQNAYDKEETSFKRIVRDVAVSDVPKNANIVTSHVFYKVKRCDDESLMLKARIAVHGNKDRDKDLLKTDSATCPPVGIRLLLSLATVFSWTLAKIDFKSAFLQTEAQRDVYMVPPRECRTRHQHYWLLLSAAYGLANAGAKWQELSDDVLREFGFLQLVYVPQLFYHSESRTPDVVAVKVVDDILFTGERSKVTAVIEKIKARYKLGTIVYGPGKIQFYGLMITQLDDFTITIDGDEKLQGYQAGTISRTRRKQQDSPLNSIEIASFRSLNSSVGWLGIAASPFCAFAASYLQQKSPSPKVKDMVTQINMLRSLKRKGTTLRFVKPIDQKQYEVSVVVFSDASRSTDYGQLGFVAGLLFGGLQENSVIHVVSWSSHKSRRPVKSVGSAETLAAGEAIDEGKVLCKAFQRLLNVKVGLWIVVDSKDLYGTLSTCRNASDRSIRGDVSVIRYEFETHNVDRMIWIPGKIKYADPLTKTDSPMSQTLELMLFTGIISVNFGSALSSSSHKSTG